MNIAAQLRPALRPLARCLPVLLVVLSAAVPWPTVAGAPQPAAANDPRFAAIDRFVAQQMQATRIPGLALGIVHDDRVVHLRGFGRADRTGRAVTPQTPFLIASVTKPLTALAVMQLVEAGAVELDAPARRYLSWFRTADEAASASITVRHLLNHTSGLPTLTGHEDMALEAQRDLGALEERVRALAGTPLSAAPGTRFQYSNAGYATLALIVEAVSGESYEAYLRRRIYEPLQMRHAFASQAAARQAGLATGYRSWFGFPLAYDWSYNRAELGAGFTYASAEDLTHLLVAQLNDGRYGAAQILSPAGIAMMQAPAAQLPQAGPWVEQEAYGLGWFVRDAAGVRTVAHSGVAPNFFADLVLVPESRWGVVVLANSMNHIRPAPIAGITSGVIGMLVGAELQPAISPSDLMPTILNLVLGAIVIQALAISWALWRRTTLRSGTAWTTIPPIVLSLVWAATCLVVVPRVFRWPLAYLRFEVPDLGYALLLSGTIALAWGVLRPLALLAWRRRRASDPALAEAT